MEINGENENDERYGVAGESEYDESYGVADESYDVAGESQYDERYGVAGEKGKLGFIDHEIENALQKSSPDEKGPLVISTPFPFINGKPQSALIGETSASEISIKNVTSEPIELWSVNIYSSNPEDSFVLSIRKPPTKEEEDTRFVALTSLEDKVILPNETWTIWISCTPKEIGMHVSAVHFKAGDTVERFAFLLAEDEISQALFANKPYMRIHREKKLPNHSEFVGGSRPSRTGGHRRKFFTLPQYAIPDDLRRIVEDKQIPNVLHEKLSDANYFTYFSALLIMEEISLEEAMRAHDIMCATMRRRGSQLLSLEVPGLAERRPSLVVGDYIFARLDGDNTDKRAYQGYIHRVEADEILLKFDLTFHQSHHDSNLYNINFAYNRTNMRKLYHAIQAAEKIGPALLFPSYNTRTRYIRTSPLKLINKNLNKEQANTVKKVLGCKGAPPYVLHGPPGTGKTVTLIEIILQVCSKVSNPHILVCASSNSAADHVLEKLINNGIVKVGEDEIFRLNAVSRPSEDVKPDLLRFCFQDEDMVFTCPTVKSLLRFKIIVSTYMSASMTYAEGIRSGHFTHIILDEAGQASEPENMIPISNLCTPRTVVVLAGDPMQLGPVIYSREAESRGLGKSYMERLLCECDFYECGNDNYITKLVRNYRCHPAILELPSKLFYDDLLMPCKEESDYFDYDSLDIPNKMFPVYFIDVQGFDEREGNNPSWFNRSEASKVVEVVQNLIESSKLTVEDIGIITPYRQQVMKLRKALESLDMNDIKVGTVEQFQGQEREVIIVSTVRSTVKHNEFDKTHSLGFLTNPRRFNVAITRAKSLLVIIGNPHIISKDPYWENLLRHCVTNNSYRGGPLPTLQEQNYCNQSDTYNSNQYDQYKYEYQWDDQVSNQYADADWEDAPQESFSMAKDNDDDIPKIDKLALDENKSEVYSRKAYQGSENIVPTGWD